MNSDWLRELFLETQSENGQEMSLSDDELGSRLEEFINNYVQIIYQRILAQAPTTLRQRRSSIQKFQQQHYKLWKRGLDLLEVFLEFASESAREFNETYGASAAQEKDFLFEALIELSARSIRVGWEVLTLLSSGFADGAHARWRTAHEIAVVANFLAKHGPEVAKRHVEHQAIESYKAIRQYQEYAPRLVGYPPASEEEIARLKSARDKLCSRYGPDFAGDYGWAARVLKKKKPKFFDIEQNVELDHLRPHYKMASHNVHANPKGVYLGLGTSKDANLLLEGPSNYGLVQPGHGITIAVTQTLAPLLNMREMESGEPLLTMKVMRRLSDDIGEALLSVDRKVNRDANPEPVA